MENLNIESFSPTVAELTTLAETYKGLKINGTADKEGFEIVKRARLDLKEKRVLITKIGKGMREQAIAFQKAVIEKEKGLIAIIEPVEADLKVEEDRIEQEREIEVRRELLPMRRQELVDIGVEVESELYKDENTILSMTDIQFMQYKQNLRQQFQQQQQAILDAEKKSLEDEKKKLEDEKEKLAREKELEKVKKETEERIRVETEARMKKEAEEKEAREKKEAEDRKIAEENTRIAEQKRLEADKKYNEWLEQHGYNPDGFMITTNGNEKIMRSKVSTFTI